jgi:hypothetical protein
VPRILSIICHLPQMRPGTDRGKRNAIDVPFW